MNATAQLVALLAAALPAGAARPADCQSGMEALFREKRWAEIAECPAPDASAPAGELYRRGAAFARLNRWEDARLLLLEAAKRYPQDKRFPVELAGIAFRTKQRAAAKRHLKRALQPDGENGYVLDFLATLYLLEGNVEAALKYWNRAGKPRIESVEMDPRPAMRAALLDSAFAAAPATVWKLPQFRTTEARLELLDAFSSWRWELSPEGEEAFRLKFRPLQRSRPGLSGLSGWIRLLRGIPYLAVHPEYFGAGDGAVHLTSLVRFDPDKRRVNAAVSWPLAGEAKWRMAAFIDGRDENWDLAPAVPRVAAGGETFTMRKAEAGAEVSAVTNGNLTWMNRVSVSHRRFLANEAVDAAGRFAGGTALHYDIRLRYHLLRLPERRVRATSETSWRAGRLFASPSRLYGKFEERVTLDWLPKAAGDDWHTTARLGFGNIWGRAPLDELYILGIERDNHLQMRAHPGTRGGLKGSAPMGDRYALFNIDTGKVLYRGALLQVSAGPFLDAGWTGDSRKQLGSRQVQWDAGVQCTLKAPGGLNIHLSYGWNLRSGKGAFYGLPAP